MRRAKDFQGGSGRPNRRKHRRDSEDPIAKGVRRQAKLNRERAARPKFRDDEDWAA